MSEHRRAASSPFTTENNKVDLATRPFPAFLFIIFLSLALLGQIACRSPQDALPPYVYLGWDGSGFAQIFRQKIGGPAQVLTEQQGEITGFAISPDGRQIAYSVEDGPANSSIWFAENDGEQAQEILTCQQAVCSDIVWSPDNRRLVYERREVGQDGLPGAPRLWWLDGQSAETKTLLADRESRGYGARFSPDGQWISFFSSDDEGIQVINLEDGRSFFLFNEIGTPVAWSPDSRQFIMAYLDLVILHGGEGDNHQAHSHDYQSAVLLARYDLESEERQQISPDIIVDDGNPAWSPDGQWIAFGRKTPRTASGRQIWVSRPDGRDARALTNDLLINHGPPSWSPDGRFLLFQRFSRDNPTGDPGVWLLDVESGEMTEIASSGMLPAWLPES